MGKKKIAFFATNNNSDFINQKGQALNLSLFVF